MCVNLSDKSSIKRKDSDTVACDHIHKNNASAMPTNITPLLSMLLIKFRCLWLNLKGRSFRSSILRSIITGVMNISTPNINKNAFMSSYYSKLMVCQLLNCATWRTHHIQPGCQKISYSHTHHCVFHELADSNSHTKMRWIWLSGCVGDVHNDLESWLWCDLKSSPQYNWLNLNRTRAYMVACAPSQNMMMEFVLIIIGEPPHYVKCLFVIWMNLP